MSVPRIGLKEIVEAAVDVWRPREQINIVEWVTETIRLSPMFEASAGSYDIENNPWFADILTDYFDPRVRVMTIQKSTQVGGTLTSIVCLLAANELDPAPAIFVMPTQDEARVIRDRVYATAEASQAPLPSRVPPPRLRNLIAIDLLRSHTYLAWAGSKQRLRGKPCKRVFQTEVDVYKRIKDAGDATRTAERRTEQFFDSKIWRESSPVGDESPICAFYDTSDQRQWWVACPKCGRHQVPRFFPYKTGEFAGRGGVVGYTDAAGQHLEPEEARAKAHYVCIDGCKIDSALKAKMMRSGRWLPAGVTIDKKGRLHGTAKRSGRHRGYHLWQVHNNKKSWGDLAATYIEMHADGQLREFFQDVLGLRFRTAAAMPEWQQLARRITWTHQRGQVPKEAWFLTCGADMQEDRVYWSVHAWAPDRVRWLIDWGEFHCSSTDLLGDEEDYDTSPSGLAIRSDLAQIDDLLERTYPVIGGQNPLGRDRLKIRLIGVDANYRPHAVHDYMRARKNDRLRAIRGGHQLGSREKYRHAVLDVNTRTGKPYEGGFDIWHLQTEPYKMLMIDRLRGSANQVGAFYLPLDMVKIGQKFLRQLVNEPPVTVVDPRTGRRRTVFKPKSGKIGVDYWDTTIYAEALADMVVEQIGWSEPAFLRWRDQQRRAQSRRAAARKRQPRDFMET